MPRVTFRVENRTTNCTITKLGIKYWWKMSNGQWNADYRLKNTSVGPGGTDEVWSDQTNICARVALCAANWYDGRAFRSGWFLKPKSGYSQTCLETIPGYLVNTSAQDFATKDKAGKDTLLQALSGNLSVEDMMEGTLSYLEEGNVRDSALPDDLAKLEE